MIRNLVNAGFDGPVMPVHPVRQAVEGILAYPDIASLPRTPDMAIIMTPLKQTPELIGQLGQLGTRASVILSEVNSVSQAEREVLHQAILNAAKPFLMRVLGPDCLGLSVPAAGLNAILSPYRPPNSGHVAFVTHAGAVARAALDWGTHLGVGFSHLIGLGEAIDVDFADVLDYLAEDASSRAILLYLEHIRDPRKFMSAARRAGRVKPLIALKPRRYTADGADDAVYEAAFRRAGILRVSDRHELFNLVETLLATQFVRNDRLAIITNSYSLSLLAIDTLYHHGGRPAEFSENTWKALASLVKKEGKVGNPVDLGDHADAELYGKAMDVLLSDADVDGILVINAPSITGDPVQVADEIVKRQARSRICLLSSFVGPVAGQAARRRMMDHQIPAYETSDEAVRAFMRLVQHKRNQELLMETPHSVPEAFTPDIEAARRSLADALEHGREELYEMETMRLLAAYGIPVVDFYWAANPGEAAEVAERLGRSVALKIMSPKLANNPKMDAVMRYLESPPVVREAAEAMLGRLRKLDPEADFKGFLIQPIEYRSGASNITVGVRPGGPFGPVIYFGRGGGEAKIINDIAYGLPPLNMNLAREMMTQTRIYSVLRDHPKRAVDLDALALTLIKISQMVIDLGEIVELEINPLRASENGAVALNARVRVAPYSGLPSSRLAIRPYPKQLEQHITLPDRRQFLLRPILPEDEPALQSLVKRMPPEDLRMRFFQPIRELPHPMAARLTQIDYDREMALVISELATPGRAEVYGVVRAHTDPDNDKAEYAILVDRHMAGLGLGPMLMRRIINYCRSRGTRQLVGDVLRENEPMLRICEALGFSIEIKMDDPELRYVVLPLQN